MIILDRDVYEKWYKNRMPVRFEAPFPEPEDLLASSRHFEMTRNVIPSVTPRYIWTVWYKVARCENEYLRSRYVEKIYKKIYDSANTKQ